MTGLVRPAVGEALAHDALEAFRGAFTSLIAKRNAVVVAEIKLGQIAVQCFFAAMLIDALHAALEDREVAFNRVGVDVAAHVFVWLVVHGLV